MKKKGYRNPYQKRIYRGWVHFVLWQLGYYNDPYPIPDIPPNFQFPNPQEIVANDHPKVTWINHSSFLVEVATKKFLVDPIWNKRCSPIPFFGPKRSHPAGIDLKKLPFINYVIISHNHYDHLDRESVTQLNQLHKGVSWIVPKGVKKWFDKNISGSWVMELDWWESLTVEDPTNGEKVTFTGTPAQHFSGRGMLDKNKSLWMGCMVELFATNNLIKRFYFAGDTGYNPYDFKKIGKKFSPIDLSLLPIGVYTPRKFMRPVHINPSEAVAIHNEVDSRLSVGGHFGTFRLSKESFLHPPYELHKALKESGISWENFRVLNPGQTINW
ncbi:MAG: MBL fold metallo-hydrolase [Chlamydiia bacterium]|nr:MBL fold metallo-hydrolase [Chlamydiia bacterium]